MSVYAKHGLFVRLGYLMIAILWWVLSLPFRALREGSAEVIVLCYHAVTFDQRKRFSWQMSRIASRVVDAGQLSRLLRSEKRPPRVCVTFDDGFECLIDHALPVLRKLGIPAMIFPVLGNLRAAPRWDMPPHHSDIGKTTMSSDDIIWLAHEGLCRFGSHTQTHPDLARLAPPSQRQELFQSKFELERLIGSPVEDLALPYGAFDEEVLARAFEAGYKRVFTLNSRIVYSGLSHGVIGRFSMSPDVWPIEFLLTVDGAYAWLGAWRNLLHGVRYTLSHVFQGALTST